MEVADCLERLEQHLRELAGQPGTAVVGVAGSVAVGKSTWADHVAARLNRGGWSAEVVCTDSFLLTNDELARLGLTMRKGFPESFRPGAIEDFLRAVRSGGLPLDVSVHSHETYDIDQHSRRRVSRCDLLILEGVNALQPDIAALVDLGVYLEAGESDLASWFRTRFIELVELARIDERSFYRSFVDMDGEELDAICELTWAAINLPNLRESIGPTAANADVVIGFGADRLVARVAEQVRAVRRPRT